MWLLIPSSRQKATPCAGNYKGRQLDVRCRLGMVRRLPPPADKHRLYVAVGVAGQSHRPAAPCTDLLLRKIGIVSVVREGPPGGKVLVRKIEDGDLSACDHTMSCYNRLCKRCDDARVVGQVVFKVVAT